MAYINSELLELIIVGAFPVALLFYFWDTLPIEQGLRLMTLGITVIFLGVVSNYAVNTPLLPSIAALFGADNIKFIRPILYIPGGILTFIGILGWFPRVINYQEEILLRKKAEKLVGDKNDLIEEVLDTSRQGILLLDENFILQVANKRFTDLLNLPEELGKPGTTYKTLIDQMVKNGEYQSDDADFIYHQWVDILKNNPLVHFQRIRPNGVILDIEAKWIPGMGMLTTYTDVTQKTKAELELSKSEEKFRDFTDTASDWLWELNSDLKLSYISKLGQEMSGLEMDDLLELSLHELFFTTVTDAQWAEITGKFEDRKPFKDMQNTYNHPDGNLRHFSASGKPIFDSSGIFCGYRGVGRDITARKQVEERLQSSQKLEAIGRLSGGIAHDFNNLLAIIMGNTELLTEICEDKCEEAVPKLHAIRIAAERGGDLTQQMLSYSRKQRLSPTAVNLKQGISGIVQLIDRSFGDNIAIKTHHSETLWHALCDIGQMEEAIVNLANNAKDAMPSGGTLTVTTSNHVQKAEDNNSKYDLEPGDYVAVTISDTGIGMSAETVKQAFEPFFTTKDVGKGTGLGLSMVFGFAKQSNGHVRINSKLGGGTSIKLFLPRAIKEARLIA